MRLFNASSIFNDDNIREILKIAGDSEKLREKLIEVKKTLLKIYDFKVYNVPAGFSDSPYIIASNHLTDSDAPLIISCYYELMHKKISDYPALFVFAKENCFNGVSIPKELMPVLEMEKIFAVDRKSYGGSMAAMNAAKKWFAEGGRAKHFLIFSQGTIFDINQDSPDDIEPGAFWLGRMLNIPVLPAFIEQTLEGSENRLIFGKPISVPPECRDFAEYKRLWLERVTALQNELTALTGVPPRTVNLDEEHRTRKKFQNAEMKTITINNEL